jgi:hypothetical protein
VKVTTHMPLDPRSRKVERYASAPIHLHDVMLKHAIEYRDAFIILSCGLLHNNPSELFVGCLHRWMMTSMMYSA